MDIGDRQQTSVARLILEIDIGELLPPISLYSRFAVPAR
jgi:hypothetical protein